MPTDIAELCIATCCIAAMALVRSETLACADGLDRATRAVATGMASTVLLVISNCAAYLLAGVLSPLLALPPSTLGNAAAPALIAVTAAIVVATIAAMARLHAPLHRLLTELRSAIIVSTLLLAVVTTLLAPARHLLHAALTAVGAGFGFTLLLRVCVALDQALGTEHWAMARAAAWQRIAGNATGALLSAGALAALVAAIRAAW